MHGSTSIANFESWRIREHQIPAESLKDVYIHKYYIIQETKQANTSDVSQHTCIDIIDNVLYNTEWKPFHVSQWKWHWYYLWCITCHFSCHHITLQQLPSPTKGQLEQWAGSCARYEYSAFVCIQDATTVVMVPFTIQNNDFIRPTTILQWRVYLNAVLLPQPR